ncbi:MAG: sensor histidine kinase [Gemmatimonadota bacterium]
MELRERTGIHRVIDGLLADWKPEGAEVAVDRETAAEAFEWLVEALASGERGGHGPIDPTGIEPSVARLRRSLLNTVRRELVQCWSAEPSLAPDTTSILDTLSSMDALEDTLSDAATPGAESAAAEDDDLDGGPDASPLFPILSEVAHDLRSPLTSILFLSETLWRGHSGPVTEIQHRQLGLIYSAALGLIALLGDMIEYARGGEVLADNERAPFSVAEMFDAIERILQPLAEEKGVTLRTLPPEPDRRLGHRVAVSRVLLNLATNALKFTDEGFVEIVARPTEGDVVQFSVRDTGRGISESAQETLFEPFRSSRARESGYYFSGTGLGLSIAQRLVHAMNAELEYETRAGWGTRFYFELPLPPATSGDG